MEWPLRLAFSSVWMQRKYYVASIACHLGEALLLLLLPATAASLAPFAPHRAGPLFLTLAAVMVALVALAVMRYLGTYLGMLGQERAIYRTRLLAFERGQLCDDAALSGTPPGALAACLTGEIESIVHFASDLSRGLLPAVLTLSGACLLIARRDWVIALAALAAVLFAVGVMRLLVRRLRPASRIVTEQRIASEGLVTEAMELRGTTLMLARHQQEKARYALALERLLSARVTEQRAYAVLHCVGLIVASAGFVAALGVLLDRGQSLSADNVVSSLLYCLVLIAPVTTAANFYGSRNQARVAAERVIELFRDPAQHPDSGARLPRGRGALSIEAVEFSYPGRGPLLSGVTFAIEPGEIVALAGENGAGKTTLCRLILRLLQPTDGAIRFDGADIQSLCASDLRRAIGVVSQRDDLWNRSIGENIAMGCEQASREQVIAAARAALLDDFVSALPDGYDTPVGPGGIALSGGQRQRLKLARALIRQPRLLILDEPTAMFDPVAEEELARFAATWSRGCSVLLISHSPNLLSWADRRVTLHAGRVTSYR